MSGGPSVGLSKQNTNENLPPQLYPHPSDNGPTNQNKKEDKDDKVDGLRWLKQTILAYGAV
ncbi:hypothetical protein N7449_005763 [Penicillium cf. viridicatum]|uniref:Uncharacterized protein n=1 Tax=Penicillium cf. viridicatum TaxID=2972119 RepID=A0A9W9SWG9_9EURO|nr:hypothetical protein N7449_005763 [Penicillium cf. viridicatum]